MRERRLGRWSIKGSDMRLPSDWKTELPEKPLDEMKAKHYGDYRDDLFKQFQETAQCRMFARRLSSR